MQGTIESGDKTVFHTHRFPVTVSILEGSFPLEMEGGPPAMIRAGQAMVIVYVSDLDTPFLDPIQ